MYMCVICNYIISALWFPTLAICHGFQKLDRILVHGYMWCLYSFFFSSFTIKYVHEVGVFMPILDGVTEMLSFVHTTQSLNLNPRWSQMWSI